MYDKGIVYVRDVLNSDGTANPYDSFLNKFNLSRCPFTLYWGIIRAIPIRWKVPFTPGNDFENNFNECTLDRFLTSVRVSKFIYDKCISNMECTVKAVRKLNDSFHFDERT